MCVYAHATARVHLRLYACFYVSVRVLRHVYACAYEHTYVIALSLVCIRTRMWASMWSAGVLFVCVSVCVCVLESLSCFLRACVSEYDFDSRGHAKRDTTLTVRHAFCHRVANRSEHSSWCSRIDLPKTGIFAEFEKHIPSVSVKSVSLISKLTNGVRRFARHH